MKSNKRAGQNTAEYVMMLVLVAGAAIATFTVFGKAVGKRFSDVISAMNGEAVTPDTTSASDLDTKMDSWGINSFNSLEGGANSNGSGGNNAGGSGGGTN